ncbi:piggyBac transposable element-derived protein 4-like [Montipora foliosa]|uniref:piggyBac transposable element-derived protein 4-like n=1 Tax=Montipora foliosa TaxID=591990 RepID=UPI0035F1815E
MKAVDYFQIYFTEAVWNLIVKQTNLYTQQKRAPDDRSVWYPVTFDEFKAWVAMILNMEIVQKPTIHFYWRTKSTIQNPFFPSIMSRNRFLQIMRYLHFTDNQEEVRDKNSPDYEKLFKIRKLLDLLLPRLSEVYNPERNLAVDETLVKFKGKIYLPQFIPIKPGRFGMRCFTLAESSRGYVSNIYTGKEQGVQQNNLVRRAVMDLMDKFRDKGYVLFEANYYTAVPLPQELSSRGTLAYGTVQSNRKGLPKDITNPGSG